MQKAQARGATVWSTPWSPPAYMKSNNDVNNGGYLLAQYYQDYANFLANYVTSVKNQGVNLYAISLQNEPDLATAYESCQWSAQQFHDFVQVIGPTFKSRNITTKLLLPENSWWNFDLASTTMNDANTAQYISILATHAYGGTISATNQHGKDLWETEVSDFNSPDNGIDSALKYAQMIHEVMNVGANAYHYWWLVSGNNDNEGLLTPSYVDTKRLWMMGNFAKFVRPGWLKIDASGSFSGIYVSAYRHPTNNNFAIVAVNLNYNNSTVTINFSGFTCGPTVDQWVTSSQYSLVRVGTVATVNSASLKSSLLSRSIVTFVGVGKPTMYPASSIAISDE